MVGVLAQTTLVLSAKTAKQFTRYSLENPDVTMWLYRVAHGAVKTQHITDTVDKGNQ